MDNTPSSSDWKMSGKVMLLYTQSYFISIASVLGTGVLGLPATLSKSGFYPFLITFILNLIMQVLSICQMVEVLQYASAILSKSGYAGYFRIKPLKETCIDSEDRHESSTEESEEPLGISGPRGVSGTEERVDCTELDSAPCSKFLAGATSDVDRKCVPVDSNLYAIGKLFMPSLVQPLFTLTAFFQFIVIGISYSLAGSEAYAELFGVSTYKMIPYFTWILAVIVILGHAIIKPAIAVMTFAKGSLLCATVAVTMYSGAAINQDVIDNWAYTDEPLLMGIVALSGLVLTMPMLFDKFQPVQNQMQGFRNAIIGGLVTCAVLNILWCWAVLKVVPQTAASCNVTLSSSSFAVCDPTLTLEAANLNGEIATVPLTRVIVSQYPDIQWIALAIEIFILISITVSFLTIGSAMQHFVCGWVDDSVAQHERWKISSDCCHWLRENYAWHVFTGSICFSAVFLVAMLNPKGFIVILGRISSLFTNAICGPFIFIWIRTIRSHKYDDIKVSLKTGTFLWYSHYLSLIYFTAASFYDIVTWAIGR